MSKWKISHLPRDSSGAISVAERLGTCVLTKLAGFYPSAVSDDGKTTAEAPHVLVELVGWVSSANSGEVRLFDAAIVYAVGGWFRGRRRQLTIATVKAGKRGLCLELLLERVRPHIDVAVDALAKINETFDVAESFIEQCSIYSTPLSREAYEGACSFLSVEPLSDAECDSYAVRFGVFEFPHYSVEQVVSMRLAARRLQAIEASRVAATLGQQTDVYRSR